MKPENSSLEPQWSCSKSSKGLQLICHESPSPYRYPQGPTCSGPCSYDLTPAISDSLSACSSLAIWHFAVFQGLCAWPFAMSATLLQIDTWLFPLWEKFDTVILICYFHLKASLTTLIYNHSLYLQHAPSPFPALCFSAALTYVSLSVCLYMHRYWSMGPFLLNKSPMKSGFHCSILCTLKST